MKRRPAPTREVQYPEWGELGMQVFRQSFDLVLLDFPLVIAPTAKVWVATVWPDARCLGGWGRVVWWRDETGRGWVMAPHTHLFDVWEFGADVAVDHRGKRWHAIRWYGYLQHVQDTSVQVVGPYDDPGAAWTDAQAAGERWRERERAIAADRMATWPTRAPARALPPELREVH